MDEIRFYSKCGEWECLSNFWAAPFDLDGRTWQTVEHYFQAAKTDDVAEIEKVQNAATPAKAKAAGRKVKLRPDWEAVKESVMLRALRAKFEQNAPLRATLLSTGDAVLKEAAPRDYHWGIGRTGSGKNRLGVLLMQVRSELCSQNS